jgi:uncharacterized membrane protein (DUF4010 family)
MNHFFSTGSEAFLLLLALGLGTLMGLRRELDAQSKPENERSFMGVRTAIVFTLLGTLSTMFPALPIFPMVVFGGAVILITVAYANGAFMEKRVGLTSELSALAMIFVGIFLGYREYIPAIFLTIILMVLKEFRTELHKFIATLSVPETRGALQLLIFSGAVLPFLPTEPVDPWGIVVPFNIWLLVVFISGINFMGYFLIKVIGEKTGTFLTAMLGALASSTAVTVSMAEQSLNKKTSQELLASGVMIAIGVMNLRIVLEILVVGTVETKSIFLVVLLAMAFVSFIFAFLFLKSAKEKVAPETKFKKESPFQLWPSVKFGILFVVVLAAIAVGKHFFGDSGVFVVAGLSGLADVDAVVLSSMEAVRAGELTVNVSHVAILIATVVNTVIKLVYVGFIGSRVLLKKLLPGVSLVALVGVVLWLVV